MTRLSELNIMELHRKGKWKNVNPEITGIETSSLRIRKGHVFFATPSKTSNGHGALYTDQALDRGAEIVITDQEGYQYALSNGVSPTSPFLLVENLSVTLDLACDFFFSNKPKFIMGVTGTNGKTSVVNFCQQLIEKKNSTCVTIGTLGVNGNLKIKTKNTTPDQVFIHRVLHMARNEKAEYALLEVSSHSIVQKRIKGITFKVFCFTNLSQDHLDYHKDMKSYFQSKLGILSFLGHETRIFVNIDDKYGKVFADIAKTKGFKVVTIGFDDIADVNVKVYQTNSYMQSVEIIKDKTTFSFKSNLLGTFQAINIGMALLTCETFGFIFEDMVSYCSSLNPVPGRLELVGKTKRGSAIYIDFAHTPEALKNLLKTLRNITRGNLILVFGAGGGRDKDKRKPMGVIASKYCDLSYVTDDNPRNEDPALIRKQIIAGCPDAIEIQDRAHAIAMAILKSEANDIVVIAGKGHESEQIVGNNIFPFSDFEQASIAIQAIEQSSND